MAKICQPFECHGCLRQVEKREVRWIKPFGGRVWRTDEGVLSIEPVELDHPRARCHALLRNVP